jgi:KDO2-lipid IV(A) lauroyltransferase
MGPLAHEVVRRLRVDSELWRRAVQFGVRHGPDAWVRYSPPMFGLAFWAALSEPRKNVERTLLKLKGPRERRVELADSARVFTNFASCLTESLLLGAGRGYEPRVHSRNQGADFKASHALGKGLILATANTAGWDVAGPMLATLQSHDVVVVMEPEEDRRARQLHDAARQKAGVRVMHAGNDPLAALPLLHHLRNNGLVAMKFDRTVPGMRCRKVRFLGETWQVPAGIFQLAAVTGAPILPVFTRRLGFLEYEYLTSPAIQLPRRPRENELDAAAQHLADRLEEFVRENPEQWFRFAP